MREPKAKRITFRASEEMQQTLEDTAARLKCDVSQLLRYLVHQHVIEKKLTAKEFKFYG